MSRPLVTFALFAYNQEKFILEAIKGALAQTYSPLQIILSDDCSRDKTFGIMRETASNYQGPHEIVLNRNVHNLGIGGHINRLMELAEGELIVMAAGDDISLPARTEELVRLRLREDALGVWSDLILVDEEGVVTGEYLATPIGSWQEVVQRGSVGGVVGASAAWDRRVFEVFGPLSDDAVHEDYIFEFRSVLLGKIAHVSKPLVRLRRHDATTSKSINALMHMDLPQFVESQVMGGKWFTSTYSCMLNDINSLSQTNAQMRTTLCQATETLTARKEFARLVGSTSDSGIRERLRYCLRVAKYPRELGIKSSITAFFLSIAPVTYYRLQRRWWHWKFIR